jgi:hypothetical protein
LFQNTTDATILLARLKLFPGLCLLLSAFLAWPANLPVVTPGPAQPKMTRGPAGLRAPGLSLNRLDRGSHLLLSEWSDVVDNSEGSDGRDDSWSGLPEICDRPIDLPSLVPTSIEARPLGSADLPASFPRSPQLRC